MPRDASDTRRRLLRAGEELFARHGVDGTRAAEINKAAGQSNESALQYHFGSRQGLLLAIFRKHIELTEPGRRAALDQLSAARRKDLGALVRVLVASDAESLHEPEGRDYLRIIAQVAGRADVQRGEARLPIAGTALSEVLDLVLAATAVRVPEPLARERLAAAIGLLTFALADRARRIDADEALLLDHTAFVADLRSMLVGVLRAPTG